MDAISLSLGVLLFLFAVAVIAGYIDTLAGGGGLITIPALIVVGVPPLFVLGTNKLQASVGTGTATYMMFKKGLIDWPGVKRLFRAAFIGSVCGTILVQFIDREWLSAMIPVVLFLICIYFLSYPLWQDKLQIEPLSETTHRQRVVSGIGVYDGMFGPGTGSFFALAGMLCQKQSLLQATAIAKSLNFATNVGSLIMFIAFGQVLWLVGALMFGGQMLGAWLGAHSLLKVKAIVLRGLVVLMCSLMLLRYMLS